MRRRKRKRNPSTLAWVGIATGVVVGGYIAVRMGALVVASMAWQEIKNRLGAK